MKDPKKTLWWADLTTTVEWVLYAILVAAILLGKRDPDPTVTALHGGTVLILIALLRIRILLRTIRTDAIHREIAAQNSQP
jgi:cbb3-type cytochrome oxidase subunit 1